MEKKVLVLSQQALFGKGIETLLANEPGFEIIQWESDEGLTIDCIVSHKPDIILVNCDDPQPDLSPTILSMLKEKMDVCFVGLSMSDNTISVYRGQEKQIVELSDLIKLLNEN